MLNGENNGVETMDMNEAVQTAQEEQEIREELETASEAAHEVQAQVEEAQVASGSSEAPQAPAVPRTSTKEKAHETFLAALKAHATALGLDGKEQAGFYQFYNAATGHKLYVAKQAKDVTRIDTTLPLQGMGFEWAYDLEKPNGRIACHVNATVEAVSAALEILASHKEKIRSPKREAKAAATEQVGADKK